MTFADKKCPPTVVDIPLGVADPVQPVQLLGASPSAVLQLRQVLHRLMTAHLHAADGARRHT